VGESPLSVLFLWHQHQPFYKDLLSNRYEMPWVRLHATKDYVDMAALLDEFPKIRSNFNLVPSLLAQLDEYASGQAKDAFVELTLKKASELSFEDKVSLLKNFYMANWSTMVEPWPRYHELLLRRGYTTAPEDLPRVLPFFKEADWRDLQMWFNLSWMDPYWRDKDDHIRSFFQKGRGFTEEDKQTLVRKQMEICGQVTAVHRRLQDSGQIEVSATPFYHPILPLLCDTQEAHMAMPNIPLPRHFQHPEDAQEQIARAIADHTQRFGQPPRGFWPSEGSVSETVARLFIQQNVRWIATDEAILQNSLKGEWKRDLIYQPWVFRHEGRDLNFFFRDHALSDAIGFVYASWDPTDAAKDFMGRLKDIQKRLGPGKHVVPVILDGENYWEYYKEDGRPFLRELYRMLSEDPTIQTVRASDYLDQVSGEDKKVLPRLWSGSWIFANFAIWIGHSEDRQAWDLLLRTREFLMRYFEEHPGTRESEHGKLAWEEILIAEGSDWCWWYGDDHSSANDETFDSLFRKHLMNVYSLMGEKPPEDLYRPIKNPRRAQTVLPPNDFIDPKIDGRVTSYYEWQQAGKYETVSATGGAMHRVQNLVQTLYFGFSLKKVFLRIDFAQPLTPEQKQTLRFKLLWTRPGIPAIELQIHPETNQATSPTPGISAAYDRTLEIALPLSHFPADHTGDFELTFTVLKAEQELERWPTDKPISFPKPAKDAFAETWSV